MSESNSENDQRVPAELISTAEIQSLCIDDRLADFDIVDAEHHGRHLLTGLDDEISQKERAGLSLVASILNMHFRPNDGASPYGAKLVMEDRRSPIPSDFSTEQILELSSALNSIRHPGIRARLADVCWLQHRQSRATAETAISAYLECVTLVLSGGSKHEFNDEPGLDFRSIELLIRAFQITRAITARDAPLPEPIKDLTRQILDTTQSNKDPNLHCRALEVAFRNNILTDKEIAKRAKGAVEWEATDHHWNKKLLHLAASAFRSARDDDAENACLVEIAETSVKIAHSGDGSGMFRSSWLSTAIEEIRRARGPEARDRAKELQAELREAQKDITFEMSTHTFEIDLTDLAEQTLSRVKGLTWSQVLALTATLRFPEDPKKVREEAIEALTDSPLSAMMGGSIVDSEGKTVAKKPGGGASNEETVIAQVADIMRHSNTVFINGQWKPVRQGIQSDTSVDEEDFEVICAHSPFVPASHQAMYCLGFARLFQGDMISAVSILFPMLETSLRYVLNQAGHDPSKIEADMTQEDRGLSALLERQKDALEKVFGEAIVFEIDMLFNHRLGPRMRHEQAHGKFSPGHCYSPNAQAGCWLLYHLTCLPLLNEWEQIGPEIDKLAKGRSIRAKSSDELNPEKEKGKPKNGET